MQIYLEYIYKSIYFWIFIFVFINKWDFIKYTIVFIYYLIENNKFITKLHLHNIYVIYIYIYI